MIVVDTSALIAILQEEAMASACEDALAEDVPLLMSAGTLAEANVVAARRDMLDDLRDLVNELKIEIVPVDAAVAEAVGRAYARWGKGLHPATLNFGDCFAYALALERGCPLLFVGDDFAKTDVVSALR